MRLFVRRVRGLFGASLLLVLGGGAALTIASPAGCAKPPPCARNSDCMEAYCSNGECKQDCVDSEVDCPHGTHCNIVAQCEADEPSGSTATGAGGASSTSSTASTMSAGGAGPGPTTTAGPGPTSGVTTGATSGTGGNNPGGKATFDPCSADGECAPNLACRPLTRNGTLRCTPTCASNAGCPAGTRCETLAGSSFCAGIDVGRPCADGSSCNFACVPVPNYCTMQCSTGADCPNGYGCMAIGGQSVCVKAEVPCSSQDTSACVGSAFCDESPNLVVGGCHHPLLVRERLPAPRGGPPGVVVPGQPLPPPERRARPARGRLLAGAVRVQRAGPAGQPLQRQPAPRLQRLQHSRRARRQLQLAHDDRRVPRRLVRRLVPLPGRLPLRVRVHRGRRHQRRADRPLPPGRRGRGRRGLQRRLAVRVRLLQRREMQPRLHARRRLPERLELPRGGRAGRRRGRLQALPVATSVAAATPPATHER